MLGEQREGAVEGERRGILPIIGALIAIEAVTGAGINVDRHVRVGGADFFDGVQRDQRIGGTEVHDRRAGRPLVQKLDDVAAVVDGGRGERQLAGGKVGDGPAPTIAGNADAPRRRQGFARRLDVEDRQVPAEFGDAFAALGDTGVVVAELNAALQAVEQRRCNRLEAGGGEAVADAAPG